MKNTSKLTFKVDSVLWQNEKWSIELLDEKDELAITDGLNVCYAYYDKEDSRLYFDVICCPKYVQKKALSLCKKHNVISIYS